MNKDEEITKSTFSPLKGVKITNNAENCTQEPFVGFMQSLDRGVPKHFITLDEKYLRDCLELVDASAMRGISSSSVPASLSLQMSSLLDEVSSLSFTSRYSCELSDVVRFFPPEAGTIEYEPMGMVVRSKGGVHLANHPSFRQCVGSENGMVDATKSAINTISKSSRLRISSIPKPQNKIQSFESDRFKLENQHKRHILLSRTSMVSDCSSFPVLGNFKRGMLNCTLKDGIPRYVFSLDGRTEVYIANLNKPDPSNYDGFDYLYSIYFNEAYLVGNMRVSTSFKLCRNNMKIKETEFVLFGEDESDTGEVQASTRNFAKKSKGLSKKMSEVFKREKTTPKYASTNEKPFVGLSTDFSPNLELVSIIVKDHVCEVHQELEVAGWGMKFLKKNESKGANSSIDASFSPCDYFVENKSDCSTNMNIIIPYGFHGGPRNQPGGPTSLIERWRSGGKCDCGGWDIGCPIKVLDTTRNEEENLSHIDIRVSGMRDSSPLMKMVSIRDGLYVLHFESNLSALQSFAIAVSIIHSQTVQ